MSWLQVRVKSSGRQLEMPFNLFYPEQRNLNECEEQSNRISLLRIFECIKRASSSQLTALGTEEKKPDHEPACDWWTERRADYVTGRLIL